MFNTKKMTLAQSLLLSFFIITPVGVWGEASDNRQCHPGLGAQARIELAHAQGRANALLESANTYSEIAADAQMLNRTSASIALASGSLMMSASALTYALQLNPGLIGSVITFLRVPTGVAGTAVAIGLSNALQLHQVSTLLSNSLIVSLGFAAAHFESAYLVGRGVYELMTSSGPIQFHQIDLERDQITLEKALALIQLKMDRLLDSPPGPFENALSLGGKNADHFQRLAELAQLRALIADQLFRLSLLESRGTCLP